MDNTNSVTVEAAKAAPHIKWAHVDGPLLCCSDGTPIWLTLGDVLRLRLNLVTVEELDARYRGRPTSNSFWKNIKAALSRLRGAE